LERPEGEEDPRRGEESGGPVGLKTKMGGTRGGEGGHRKPKIKCFGDNLRQKSPERASDGNIPFRYTNQQHGGGRLTKGSRTTFRFPH